MLDWLLIWNTHKKSIWHCSTQNNEKHQISITKYHCNPFYQEITHKYDVKNESVNCLYCWTHRYFSFFLFNISLTIVQYTIHKQTQYHRICIYSVELSKNICSCQEETRESYHICWLSIMKLELLFQTDKR